MKAAQTLHDALLREADAQQAVDNYAVAHDLRSAARNVSSAGSLLKMAKDARARPPRRRP